MIGLDSDFDLLDDYLDECRDRLVGIGNELLKIEHAGGGHR